MLPRKAPSALKTFHELAVGVKDAYAAVGKTPQQPEVDKDGYIVFLDGEDAAEAEGRNVLWEFMGNLDFVRFSSSIQYTTHFSSWLFT